MPSRRKVQELDESRRRPAKTPEAREHEMINLAHDLAAKQIREGSASSQVVTHFLKLGSTREQLEQARLEHEIQLMRSKQESLEAASRMEEVYTKALDAMRSYAGHETPEQEFDEELF